MSGPQTRKGKHGGDSDLRMKIELRYWYERDAKTGGLRLKHEKVAINRD